MQTRCRRAPRDSRDPIACGNGYPRRWILAGPPGLDPVRARIVDLCDDAGVANKSLRRRSARVRKFVRSRRPLARASGGRQTATLVMRAIYSLQPGPIQVRRDTAVPGALLFKSYLPGAIFDHNNGIDKTVPLMQNA